MQDYKQQKHEESIESWNDSQSLCILIDICGMVFFAALPSQVFIDLTLLFLNHYQLPHETSEWLSSHNPEIIFFRLLILREHFLMPSQISKSKKYKYLAQRHKHAENSQKGLLSNPLKGRKNHRSVILLWVIWPKSSRSGENVSEHIALWFLLSYQHGCICTHAVTWSEVMLFLFYPLISEL